MPETRTEAEQAWARFRRAHPELYSDAVKQAPEWPYVRSSEQVRVA